jgi:ABC-2 type transport system ATP-binding protein
VLAVREISKTYTRGLFRKSSFTALKNISLEVRPGEIFGYLGPNGSGKTTTLKILIGLVFPDRGEIQVLGQPHASKAWRARVGYLPEQPYFYDYLTPAEYLDYAGRLFGLSPATRRQRTKELLDLVGLARSADVALRRFSKGMQQRLGLAQALVNDPELLFLDEPMSGLDPIGRRMVRDIILSQRDRGKTVFFSTHILPDAETLCDRVAVLRGGELVATGRIDDILHVDVSHVEILVSGLDADALARLPLGGGSCVRIGERARLEVTENQLAPVVSAVQAAAGRVLSVQPIRRSLEEFFFEQIGGSEAAARALEAET